MEKHELETQGNDLVPEYEPPVVIDYGTLVDITRAGTLTNADSDAGIANTAFPLHS